MFTSGCFILWVWGLWVWSCWGIVGGTWIFWIKVDVDCIVFFVLIDLFLEESLIVWVVFREWIVVEWDIVGVWVFGDDNIRFECFCFFIMVFFKILWNNVGVWIVVVDVFTVLVCIVWDNCLLIVLVVVLFEKRLELVVFVVWDCWNELWNFVFVIFKELGILVFVVVIVFVVVFKVVVIVFLVL